jgi:metallo-beta-lactamase family protein
MTASGSGSKTPLTLLPKGAAGTVTGSRFLLSLPDGRGLLLDYGLFQGDRELRDRNLAPPDAETRDAGAVVLSHAHLDHSGALPVLVKSGWQGRVYATPTTAGLCAIMLPDSGRIQEEDAAHANRHGSAGKAPTEPLYTEQDAIVAAQRFTTEPYHASFQPVAGVTTTFFRAGHIPGSSLVLVEAPSSGGMMRLLFSGDLGRYDAPILPDPELPPDADYIMMESTYGDRDHPPGDAGTLLANALQQAMANGGPILVPAFAVGRTQELLYALRLLEDQGRVPALPVYVDSPLVTGATAVLSGHPEEFDEEMARRIVAGSHPLEPHNLHIIRSADESKKLNELQEPAIIIAGSGMATGGRILHHLEHHLGDPRTTVLFVGYQGRDTLGRTLLDGADQVRMYGQTVPVRAHIMDVQGLSAHADRREALRWLRGAQRPPKRVLLVHGESPAPEALQQLIQQELGWPVSILKLDEPVLLT